MGVAVGAEKATVPKTRRRDEIPRKVRTMKRATHRPAAEKLGGGRGACRGVCRRARSLGGRGPTPAGMGSKNGR